MKLLTPKIFSALFRNKTWELAESLSQRFLWKKYVGVWTRPYKWVCKWQQAYRIKSEKIRTLDTFNFQYSAVTHNPSMISPLVSLPARSLGKSAGIACLAHIQRGWASSGCRCIKPTNSHQQQPSKYSLQFVLKTSTVKIVAGRCQLLWIWGAATISILMHNGVPATPAHNTSTRNAAQHWTISSHRSVEKASRSTIQFHWFT